MKKRLITRDYEQIVFESLKIPKKDCFNYYLNIVEEKYYYNNDIIEKLKQAVSKWIIWYNYKVYKFFINKEFIETDLEKTLISLFPEFGIKKQVNKDFFDFLLNQLNLIQENIKTK